MIDRQSFAPGADWVPDEAEYRERMARWRDASRTDLEALTSSQGPDDFETLDVRGNVAEWTGEAGDPSAARDLYAALIDAHTGRSDFLGRDLATHHPWWAARSHDAE
ncbi:hypothetical protein GCM10023205_58340 [Yinghuangia aomiensis]|uniref:Sulfatase-modifying factor enzyme domain-containing protein n=1 Tax=Yinghuangia aomiensis TaxID=676205 RepID=A0ABP9HXD0_9ACTN